MSHSLDGIILDYGCVLSRPQAASALHAMVRLSGVEHSAFEAAYWQHRAPYDAGLPAETYWTRVLTTLGVLPERRRDVIPELIRHDVDSWNDAREEMWTLAEAVRATGLRLALLSNCTEELLARLQAERRLALRFDAVVASCDAGVVKPDRRIYEICLEKLGTPAAATLFVDDREENLRAARAVGIKTFHFTGDESIEPLRLAIFGTV
jgi:putative hydrolase of the HAD superfamily